MVTGKLHRAWVGAWGGACHGAQCGGDGGGDYEVGWDNCMCIHEKKNNNNNKSKIGQWRLLQCF